jgi:glycosyltransferase involved in cell wall biosynthesis
MAMNWVFLDLIPWDYDVVTPLIRPLGGSQSALCYLAVALAKRGHTVTTLTGTSQPRDVMGVCCRGLTEIPRDLFARPDTVAVVLNGPAAIGQQIRQHVPHGTQLILWTQHAHDQPAMAELKNAVCLAAWDRIVCVSEWHRTMVHEKLGVPRERIDVQKNAVAPVFERIFADASELTEAKSGTLRLAYTSTPFRGLDVLLNCFPQIRRSHPTCRLEVFSSMGVYGQSPAEDPYRQLYIQCQVTDGIEYRGSVPQPQLARELSSVCALVYPNTFAETSCIAVMEALAAGALVVTSDLGALSQTCDGWARLVPPLRPGRSRAEFERDFVAVLDAELTALATDPAGFMRRRWEQVTAINTSCTWDVRAREWEAAAAAWLTAV